MNHSRRSLMVFSMLLALLGATSILLVLLAPEPLVPDASRSLFAIESPPTLEGIFDTRVPPAPGRWHYIYIRHSKTASGDARSIGQGAGLGDHFVIGNGDGAGDGEIQIGHRWMQQLPAAAPPGATGIDASCISICLIGDFDTTVPTPTQLRRLAQLVGTLQVQFQIPAQQVFVFSDTPTPAGLGRHFPVSEFRQQLLR